MNNEWIINDKKNSNKIFFWNTLEDLKKLKEYKENKDIKNNKKKTNINNKRQFCMQPLR